MIFCGGIFAAAFYSIAAARDGIPAACFHCAAIRFRRTAAALHIGAVRDGAFFVAFLATRGKILSARGTSSACLISLHRFADLLRRNIRVDQRALRITIKKI